MILPSHFLPRPPMSLDPATIAAFENLFAASVERGPGSPIEYRLSAPKWQFLCYLCDRKGIVLHGSNDAGIAELVPRKAKDVNPFGNREAVYAAADGIWPIYFAVVDRTYPNTSLLNGCIRVTAPAEINGSYYFFSISADVEPGHRWRDGTVYLLPGQSFVWSATWTCSARLPRSRSGTEIATSPASSAISPRLAHASVPTPSSTMTIQATRP